MSEFIECETKLKDRDALVHALIEMGWSREEIEIHDTPQHLYGYQGDKRPEKANIIIRRKNVGNLSNDIGFRKKTDGTYEAIISDYDRNYPGHKAKHTGGYNEKWLNNLSAKYAENLFTSQAKKKGYQVKKTVKGTKVMLHLYKS